MTFAIFIGIYVVLVLLAALGAMKKTKSNWTVKNVFGKMLLLNTTALLGLADILLSGARFPALQVEISSAFQIAKDEVLKRV